MNHWLQALHYEPPKIGRPKIYDKGKREAILKYLSEHENATRYEIAENTGIPPGTVFFYLHEFLKSGAVTHTPARKVIQNLPATWSINA